MQGDVEKMRGWSSQVRVEALKKYADDRHYNGFALGKGNYEDIVFFKKTEFVLTRAKTIR